MLFYSWFFFLLMFFIFFVSSRKAGWFWWPSEQGDVPIVQFRNTSFVHWFNFCTPFYSNSPTFWFCCVIHFTIANHFLTLFSSSYSFPLPYLIITLTVLNASSYSELRREYASIQVFPEVKITTQSLWMS